jgi:hypothetical protein
MRRTASRYATKPTRLNNIKQTSYTDPVSRSSYLRMTKKHRLPSHTPAFQTSCIPRKLYIQTLLLSVSMNDVNILYCKLITLSERYSANRTLADHKRIGKPLFYWCHNKLKEYNSRKRKQSIAFNKFNIIGQTENQSLQTI